MTYQIRKYTNEQIRAIITQDTREKRLVASIIDEDESGIVTVVPSSPRPSPGWGVR